MGMCCSATTRPDIYFEGEKINNDQLLTCLAQECAVSSDTAQHACKNNNNLPDIIFNLLDNRSYDSRRPLPPFAGLIIHDVNKYSVSLCSRKTAMKLLSHRVAGNFSDADRLLHETFAAAQNMAIDEANRDVASIAPVVRGLHNVPSKTFECAVCYDEIKPQDGTRLNCSHQFCTSCLSDHIANCLNADGSNLNVPCIDPNCTKLITELEVRQLCPRDIMNVAIVAATDNLIAADHCLRRCQTADCNYVFHFCPIRKESALAVCPVCNVQSTKPTIDQLVNEERELQALMQQYQVRRCARCGTGVQKSSGCNKLKCRCGYRFCYVCGSENAQCLHTPFFHGFIDNLTGYGDFSDLNDKISPDKTLNASMLKSDARPRCINNHHLELNKKGTKSTNCALCHESTNTYYSCIAGCKFHVCVHCYLR